MKTGIAAIRSAALITALFAIAPAFAQERAADVVSGADRAVEGLVQDLEVHADSVTIDAPNLEVLTVHVGTAADAVHVLPRHAADLTIEFAHDSAEITDKGKAVLDQLGAALVSSSLERQRFLLAGHTDAAGAAAYNMQLSLARAQAAKDYLVRIWGVSPDRLIAHGWGESRPKIQGQPFNSANRRVEIIAIADPAILTIRNSSDLSSTDIRVTVQDRLPNGSRASNCVPDLVDPRKRSFDLDDFGASRRPRSCD